MRSIKNLFLIMALMIVPVANADDFINLDEAITVFDILNEDSVRSSCNLAMPAGGNGVRCSCSGTTCTSSGSGSSLVITCSDSEGTTTCSYDGGNCSCVTANPMPKPKSVGQ